MNLLIVATIVALTNEFGVVSVDTCGAHVLSYVPAGVGSGEESAKWLDGSFCVEPAILPRMEGIWLDPEMTYEIGMSIQQTKERE